MSRLLKVYFRDKKKVFRAIDGIEFTKNSIIIDKSVYTSSSIEDDDFIILNKR